MPASAAPWVRGALTKAWTVVRPSAAQAWLAGGVLMIADGSWVPSPVILAAANANVQPSTTAPPGVDPAAHATVVAGLCALVAAGAFTLLSAWIEPGYLRVQRSALARSEIPMAPLVTGLDRFWAMLAWKLAEGGITAAAALVAALPGLALVAAGVDSGAWLAALPAGALALAVQVRLAFGEPLVALEGLGVGAALVESWRMTRGRFLRTLWVLVAVRLVYALGAVGLVLLVVGALVTVPLARFAGDLVFLDAYAALRPARSGTSGGAPA